MILPLEKKTCWLGLVSCQFEPKFDGNAGLTPSDIFNVLTNLEKANAGLWSCNFGTKFDENAGLALCDIFIF